MTDVSLSFFFQPQMSGDIYLCVKTLSGLNYFISCEHDTTLREIKEKLRDKTGIPIVDQRLVWGNSLLCDDNFPLSAFDMGKEPTLRLLLRFRQHVPKPGPVLSS